MMIMKKFKDIRERIRYRVLVVRYTMKYEYNRKGESERYEELRKECNRAHHP